MITVARMPVGRAALLATLVAWVMLVAGCGSSNSTSSSSTASPPSSSSSPVDLATLLIQPSDIPIPGFTQKLTQPVQQGGASGITALFANADDTRQLGDTILLVADAASAKAVVQTGSSVAQSQFAGASSTPVQVGEMAFLYSGAKDGKSSTILIFQEGRAVVTIGFDGALDDPVPASVVTAVGQAQDNKIKAGLK